MSLAALLSEWLQFSCNVQSVQTECGAGWFVSDAVPGYQQQVLVK